MKTLCEVYPAIDLRNGQVVRLKYGDPAQQTVFGDDPIAAGRRWLAAGAAWLHVVNLDGAFDGPGEKNWAVLPQLASLPADVQFGGGIRTAADIERALACGVSRVVLGTAAVENPALLADAISRFGPQKITAGIDARDGEVKTRGWQTGSGRTPENLARDMKKMGITTIIHTDIGRDGVLSGVNAAASAELATATGLEVIASGGVSTLDDVKAVCDRGLAGVIIGRALYDGRFTLQEALAVRDQAEKAAGSAIKGEI